MNPDQIKQIIEALKSGDGEAALTLLEGLLTQLAGGEPDADDAPADPAAAAADPPKPDPAKPQPPMTNSKEFDELRRELAALRAKNDELDLESRRELIAELVKLGIETPATAWKDKAAQVPCARLTVEPIREMRERIALLRGSAPRRATPPSRDVEDDDTRYSPAVKARLAKMTPEQKERFERHQAALASNRKNVQ